jgi:hypothetical protein
MAKEEKGYTVLDTVDVEGMRNRELPNSDPAKGDNMSYQDQPGIKRRRVNVIANDWPTQAQATAYYGDPSKTGWLSANTTFVKPPWPIFIEGKPVTEGILIHKKVAPSLIRVLGNVWDAVGHDVAKIKELHYDQYDGSYNYRPIRGGHSLSMHSYAVAIDWDAQNNQQHDTHHFFTDSSLLIVKFKEESWIWGGDWSVGSIDAMHVQAARIR